MQTRINHVTQNSVIIKAACRSRACGGATPLKPLAAVSCRGSGRRRHCAPASRAPDFDDDERAGLRQRFRAEQRAHLHQRQGDREHRLDVQHRIQPATTRTIRVIDAVASSRSAAADNIWAGRFLPPSDRANLYGPYYANHWGVYQDGVQDGYPFETKGRDDGIMYWGQFGIAKVSFGAFDVQGLTKGDSDVLYAGRVQMDFWDQEDGYYLNGTYYGEKDLLALGVAAQTAARDNAYSVDFLLEKKLGNRASSRSSPNTPSTTAGRLSEPDGCADEKRRLVHARRLHVPASRSASASSRCSPSSARRPMTMRSAATSTRTRTEFDLNYLIKDVQRAHHPVLHRQELRSDSARDTKQIGLGLQIQI